jgi:uncharacterized membrane protein YgdD (TMEM256/DUF423 family)
VTSARALAAGGVLLALATACGAFGAHALRAQLTPERMHLWETAVRYQFLQALGLVSVGLAMRGADGRFLHLSALLLLIGAVLFSGSLYLLALGGPRTVGVLTPLGGLACVGGWLLFAWTVWR